MRAVRETGLRHPGDGWVECLCGARHWGRNGAAGLLVWRPAHGRGGPAGGIEVLVQLRAAWTHHGGTWGLPGGAVADGESPAEAALRECEEETGLPAHALTVGACHVQDHGLWRYSTFAARLGEDAGRDRLLPLDGESSELRWVELEAVMRSGTAGGGPWAPPEPGDPLTGASRLLPALASAWPGLAALLPQPLQAQRGAGRR